jgi:hypothetical protein
MMIAGSGCVVNQEVDWEFCWAPYDEQTYARVLMWIHPDDIILDIGAGDFRLSERMALIARMVYGIEIQQNLFPLEAAAPNLVRIHSDARIFPFPSEISVGILLMRHCRHFRLYADKLKMAGARKLITNARWGMGVEAIDLEKKREKYASIDLGWYACWCGSVGFKPGLAESITPEVDRYIHEVVDCPSCQSTGV